MSGDADHPGIYLSSLNPKTGELGPALLAAKAKNPLFVTISPDGKFLYAAMESEGGAVGAFALREDGTLRPLNVVSSGGRVPCHVSMDSAGRHVFVANYGDGSIACFAVEADGSLGERTAWVQLEGSGPDSRRQKNAHAHGIYSSADDRFVYACDLGSDKVWSFQYDADKGTLTPTDPPAGVVPPGGGPRHLVFSSDERFVYATNELGISTTVFGRDPESGILTPVETVSCSPQSPGPREGVTTAEITLHPNGRWLYVSNRGDDLIAVHTVAEDGRLSLVENTPAGTAIPSGMAIDPSGKWLVVAGAKGDTVTTFAIDPESGRLRPTGQSVPVPGGFGVVFVPEL